MTRILRSCGPMRSYSLSKQSKINRMTGFMQWIRATPHWRGSEGETLFVSYYEGWRGMEPKSDKPSLSKMFRFYPKGRKNLGVPENVSGNICEGGGASKLIFPQMTFNIFFKVFCFVTWATDRIFLLKTLIVRFCWHIFWIVYQKNKALKNQNWDFFKSWRKKK